MRIQLLICVLIGLALSSCASENDTAGQGEAHNLIIATATPGGTYYPVGVAIGTLITGKLQPGITASAINSAGSGENIQMLANREAHFAILQGLFGAMAHGGKGPYTGSPYRELRSITMLWENVEHFLLLKKFAPTGNILDLKGLDRKFSIGKRGSGTEGSTRTIFSALGIDPELDLIPEYLGYSPSAQAMMDNRIVGGVLSAGPPVAAVTQAYAQLGGNGVTVLGFTDQQLETIRDAYPVWNRHTVPPGTYPGQTAAIQTIAQPNFLAVRADLSDEVVYRITRTIYENLSDIQKVHKATLAMTLNRAIAGLSVPLHPGAARYYKEQGIEIPAALDKEKLKIKN